MRIALTFTKTENGPLDVALTPPPPVPNHHNQGTPVRYSKAVQLVHEFSGALLCVDVQERAETEGFAMKVVLKTLEPPSGASARLAC